MKFTVVEEHKEYSIVWAIYKKNSDIGKEYEVWGDISLPYFVDKQEWDASIVRGEGVDLKSGMLLVGLLLKYSAVPPFTVTHKVKPYFQPILFDLLGEYTIAKKYSSLDDSFNDIARQLTREYGESLGSQVLKTALELSNA